MDSSDDTIRTKKYRDRKSACEKLAKTKELEDLWAAIVLFEGYPFYTARGLRFKYRVVGGEIFVDRKEKSITKSSVRLAYQKALEGGITGPKKLGVFGASYLYPIFVRLGVI